MKVGDICNHNVEVIERRDSLFEAARKMREAHVGSLVIIDKEKERSIPVGIITDRDVLVQVLSEGVSPKSVSAEDIMSNNLVTAREEDDVFEVIQQMRRKGVRRIPVVDERQHLIGILTLDDLLEFLANEFKNIAAISSLEREHESIAHP